MQIWKSSMVFRWGKFNPKNEFGSGTQVFLKAGVEFFGVVNREDRFPFDAMLRNVKEAEVFGIQ